MTDEAPTLIIGRADYAERQERRRDRIEERIATKSAEVVARYKRFRQYLELTNGQPILIGHHSEKSHRAAIKRMDSNLSKAVEARDEAERLTTKAAAIGSGGISSDDPDSLEKLRAKLEALKAEHASDKALSAAWRKAGKPQPPTLEDPHRDADKWDALAQSQGWGSEELMRRKAQSVRDRAYGDTLREFVPSYRLTNRNANMKRIERRIAELQVRGARNAAIGADEVRHDIGEGRFIVENVALNRVQITFPGKPSADVIGKMKSSGFRWAHTEKAWQAQLARHNVRRAFWAFGLEPPAEAVAAPEAPKPEPKPVKPGKALPEVNGEPGFIAHCRKVVAEKQAAKLSGLTVDLYSASVALQAWEVFTTPIDDPERQAKRDANRARLLAIRDEKGDRAACVVLINTALKIRR